MKSGAVLVKNRIDYVKMLSDRAVEYHNGISKGKEELKIRYMSGYEASEMIRSVKFMKNSSVSLKNTRVTI